MLVSYPYEYFFCKTIKINAFYVTDSRHLIVPRTLEDQLFTARLAAAADIEITT